MRKLNPLREYRVLYVDLRNSIRERNVLIGTKTFLYLVSRYVEPLKYNGQTNLYRNIKVHRRVISICILTGLLEKLFTLSSDGKLLHCWIGTKHFILVRSKGFEINHKAEMTYNIFIIS